ncbi:hypothetical protein TWF730_007534 [Orbilia blumenaviensis]|uniref:Uncharacterized protein n=1 Tax=Orbilia blumenaviensis TaxID=1796055 RepID=A0AAV9VAM8_9PEZI
MPVTLRPSTVKPEEYKYNDTRAKSHADILRVPLQKGVPHRCKEVFQSNFNQDIIDSRKIHPSSSAFVYAAMSAYNYHHHLVIRPDDVWITILTQFSLYVNAHAEELRSHFVAHEGKKSLEVNAVGTRYTVDFGALAVQMGELIEQNVIDPDLRTWLVPNFTTTEENDKIVSSVLMMSTLQSYFSYGIGLACGLPGVTMLGEKSDWETLLKKIDKFETFGPEPTLFAKLLRPILKRFVTCFEDPESPEMKDFWQTVVSRHGGGSGPRYIGGWITAFCLWTNTGKLQYNTERTSWGQKVETLSLDGETFGLIEDSDVTGAYAHVPVKLNDNGEKIDTIMLAGMVAIESRPAVERDEKWELKNSQLKAEGKKYEGPECPVIQPLPGWWIFQEEEGEDPNSEEAILRRMMARFGQS